MKKYLSKLTKNKMLYAFIFLFFITILTLSPISGDDWGNYFVGKGGLYHCFEQAIRMYFDWEGRLVSRILINILTYNKWLWNIINSILITIIVFGINKVVNPKRKKTVMCLSILTLLAMNIFTFSQVIVWVAGNVTYLFPFSLLLIYLILILKQFKQNKFLKTVFIILNIIIPMFVEHMAVLLIIINLSKLILDYYKTRKINKEFIIYLILSIISTLVMFLSPGTAYRNQYENLHFNKLNIIEKVIYNLPNFIYYTFIINSFFLLLTVISNNYLILKYKYPKLIKIIMITYITIIPFLTILLYNLSQFIIIPNNLLNIVNPNNLLIQLYWISYTIIWIYLIIKYKEKRINNLIFIGLGLLSNSIMLASPTWGYRTSFATYIFLMIPAINIIDDISINKILEKILIAMTVIISIIWLIFYINIRIEINNLENSINAQLKDNKEIIEIEPFPSYANCNINPTNDYHLENFKKYYNIPEEKEVVILPNKWRYVIIK